MTLVDRFGDVFNLYSIVSLFLLILSICDGIEMAFNWWYIILKSFHKSIFWRLLFFFFFFNEMLIVHFISFQFQLVASSIDID